jgi:hypothetical protein
MPAFVTPNKHTPWNFQTCSFMNSCYTLHIGYASTWCGLTFVTSLNVAIKRLYSDSDRWMNMHGYWQHDDTAKVHERKTGPSGTFVHQTNEYTALVQRRKQFPQKCSRWLSQENSVSVICTYIHKIASFKTTHIYNCQKLQEADSVARIHFCNLFCDALYSGDISPSLTFLQMRNGFSQTCMYILKITDIGQHQVPV